MSSNSMRNENILVGYFFQCLACKASFIRVVPQGFAVTHEGRIYLKEPDPIRETTDDNTARNDQSSNGADPVRESTNGDTARSDQGSDGASFVRCPCCLSWDVRSSEIGDKK